MAQGKQAKTLIQKQQDAMLAYLERSTRHPQRNKVIFLLSMKAGLRAKEIASLRWRNVCDAEGYTSDEINIEDAGSKGKGGRTIPMAPALKEALQTYRNHLSLKALPGHDRRTRPWTDIASKHDGVDIDGFIIRTERGSTISGVSAQVIVNLFQKWFGPEGMDFQGASSHSGRRTFITNAAKKISTVGGSLRDVQQLAGHSSLQTTQRYIEGSTEAKKAIVRLV
jgi:integrase/recombinase XerD